MRLNPAQLARRGAIGEERRAKMRQRLIKAAYQLFADHGYDAPTVEDVLAKAGVVRGTFYNHFKTRDILFRAVADEIATSINDLILAAEQEINDPVARLAVSFRLFVHFATIEPARGRILLRTMPLLGAINQDMHDNIRAQFEAALATGRLHDQPVEPTIDIGLGMMIMTIRRILTEKQDPKGIQSAIERLMLAFGLGPAEAKRLAAMDMDVSSIGGTPEQAAEIR